LIHFKATTANVGSLIVSDKIATKNDTDSIRIGNGSHSSATQGENCISINPAPEAGIIQGDRSICIGAVAGESQGIQSVAIGTYAGASGQGTNSVAIGTNTAEYSQGNNSVAIGTNAGLRNQENNCVAIGTDAGLSGQDNFNVAIGYHAGISGQGEYAIAIGYQKDSAPKQPKNSIVINATTETITPTASSLFIKPIRGTSTLTGFKQLYYNPTTGEIIYDST
jgi:hypothetical protein